MPLVRTPKNAYTAKIVAVTDFPDTQSLSLLLVCKTENGKAIEDRTISLNLSEEHPLAQGLYDGVVSEVGFLANGFTTEPVKGTDERPIYAMVGMVKPSLEQILGGNFATGQEVTDEGERRRKAGMASRALSWIREAVKKASDEA